MLCGKRKAPTRFRCPPMTAEAFAPAKINLTLHVTGQRNDGYHLLDSLVIFADVGDWIRAMQDFDRTHLSVAGPFGADVPGGDDNLVLRAADWFDAPKTALLLEKHLPIASGIGGGSSDAAAALHAIAECHVMDPPLAPATAALGADIPVCFLGRPTRMQGIGDELDPVTSLPPVHMVLVNPGVAVATSEVFDALSVKDNSPMPGRIPGWKDAAELADWLAQQRNDLELPARAFAPAIGVALSRIGDTSGCLLARMSGSGATCFGLYASRTEAENAAADLLEHHPNWWIRPASDWQRDHPN